MLIVDHPEHLPRDADPWADRGGHSSDMYVSGAMDSRWDNGELDPAFRSLTAGDFEVVQPGWR
jgi:hypothetical protein